MKVSGKTGHVRVVVEVDEKRYRDSRLRRQNAIVIREYEERVLSAYAEMTSAVLAGTLHMGDHTPKAFEFLNDQLAQTALKLRDYAEDVLRGGSQHLLR